MTSTEQSSDTSVLSKAIDTVLAIGATMVVIALAPFFLVGYSLLLFLVSSSDIKKKSAA